MRVLCILANPVIPPDRWIWNYLPQEEQKDEVDFLDISVADQFPKWGKLLIYYPSFLWLGIKAAWQLRRKKYDAVIAWESKCGFGLALIRRLFFTKKPKFIILAYNHRGLLPNFPGLAKFAMKSVNQLTVTSAWEKEYYAKILNFPSAKITVVPFGWYDIEQNSDGDHAAGESFILSSGRSYRDYATFFAALQGVDSSAVVLARKFNLQGLTIPSNVEVHDLLPMKEYYSLLMKAKFVVVPLIDVKHAAGDSHLAQTMSAGKAVIATRGPSTVTYVDDGKTGILVPPNDPQRMREAIVYLLDHPEETERMGKAARKRYEETCSFKVFAEQTYRVIRES